MPDHFRLHEIAPGVNAAVATATGAAVSNAAIIDLGSKTVVVDTFETAQAAAELRSAVVELTGRTAFLVVNTHWHSDHTWGNQVFDDATIVSTRTTLDLMVADAPADLAAYEAEVDGHLASIRANLDSEHEDERALAKRRIASLEQLKQAIPGFRLRLPDVLIGDRLTIAGERDLEILTYGGGHTDSDVFAWIPSDRVVAAGDLCWNGLHPRCQDGHPAAWADILDRMLALEPEHVIPGHGLPGGPELPTALSPYFRAVADLVEQVKGGADPADLPLPAGSNDWDGPQRLRTGLSVLAEG
jgi:cyclase